MPYKSSQPIHYTAALGLESTLPKLDPAGAGICKGRITGSPAGCDERPQGPSMQLQLQLQVAAGCVELALLIHRAARHVHRLLHLRAIAAVAVARTLSNPFAAKPTLSHPSIHRRADVVTAATEGGPLRVGYSAAWVHSGAGALGGALVLCRPAPPTPPARAPEREPLPWPRHGYGCSCAHACAAAQCARACCASYSLISRSHETSSARCDLRLDSTSHASAVRAVRT